MCIRDRGNMGGMGGNPNPGQGAAGGDGYVDADFREVDENDNK